MSGAKAIVRARRRLATDLTHRATIAEQQAECPSEGGPEWRADRRVDAQALREAAAWLRAQEKTTSG